MKEPLWEDPFVTPFRTEAARRLLASYPTDMASPSFLRHLAQSIHAIEAELARTHDHPGLRGAPVGTGKERDSERSDPMTTRSDRPRIVCSCGHAFSSHRQDPVDPWATERCKTCGCAAFYDREDERRDRAAAERGPHDNPE